VSPISHVAVESEIRRLIGQGWGGNETNYGKTFVATDFNWWKSSLIWLDFSAMLGGGADVEVYHETYWHGFFLPFVFVADNLGRRYDHI
jgi:hypothetical protein